MTDAEPLQGWRILGGDPSPISIMRGMGWDLIYLDLACRWGFKCLEVWEK